MTGDLFAVALALVGVFAAARLLWPVDPAWTLSLGLVCGIFSGNSHELGLPIGPDRVLITAGLAQLALRQWKERREGYQWDAVHWLLACVVVYSLSSAALSGTLTHSRAAFGLLDYLGIVPFALFVVAPVAFDTPRRRRILLGSLAVAGAYVALVTIAQGIGLNALVWPRYILDPSVGSAVDRARGPQADPVADGLALFEFAAAAALGARDWDGWRRWAAIVVASACVIAIAFTLTRAVWIGTLVAMAVTCVSFQRLRRWLVPMGIGMAVVIAGLLAIAPGFRTQASSRTADARPVYDRINTDAAAVRMIEDRPLLGFGWDRYRSNNIPYLRQSTNIPLTGSTINVHNVFLANAVELGLVGGVLWAAAWLFGIGSALVAPSRPEFWAWRAALLAALVQWLVIANFGPTRYALPVAFLWLVTGIVRGASSAPVRSATGRLGPVAPLTGVAP